MSGEAHNGGRARQARLSVLFAASALPLLVSCSSSSSVEYAAEAFPSQSLVDLLKQSKNSPPPAPNAAPPAQPVTNAAVPAPPPAYEPPPAAPAAPANPPLSQQPAATSAANDDPVASAFPSVSLIDIVTGKSGAQ